MHRIEWHFLPRPERLAEFLAAYGEDGAWVQLFRNGAGYLGTSLQALPGQPGWYRCTDLWRSAQDYTAFRETWSREYAALDADCEQLTLQEVPADRP